MKATYKHQCTLLIKEFGTYGATKRRNSHHTFRLHRCDRD